MQIDDYITKQQLGRKIEQTAYQFARDIIISPRASPSLNDNRHHHHRRSRPCLSYVLPSATNTTHDNDTKAIILLPPTSSSELNATKTTKVKNIHVIHRILMLLCTLYHVIKADRKVSQRELYYMLVHTKLFKTQAVLNNTLLQISAMLQVPRFSLGVACATRGVLSGCLFLATAGSPSVVDCRFVGFQGWPIPGDIPQVVSLQIQSSARYIIVIEKFGIFTRLVEDRIFDHLPCILICGKGYPSIATRAMTSHLESYLKIPVIGIADHNPHGLALLQCYKYGSIRSTIEGSKFICDLKWMGLRPCHIRKLLPLLGTDSAPFTNNDMAVWKRLIRRCESDTLNISREYQQEIRDMIQIGKYELQWLYRHGGGMRYFTFEYVHRLILQGDYI